MKNQYIPNYINGFNKVILYRSIENLLTIINLTKSKMSILIKSKKSDILNSKS